MQQLHSLAMGSRKGCLTSRNILYGCSFIKSHSNDGKKGTYEFLLTDPAIHLGNFRRSVDDVVNFVAQSSKQVIIAA